ncbi:hypothetical protein AB0J38_00125 [Streptomyces sp. NPDC050095]|uniref:hypothetical protein n=1 Tax=unclassified Streptomyces TaxID=2593676 RepID=UPI00343F4DFD
MSKTTPALALPYPEDTDPLRIWEDIAKLAQAIDTWSAPTLVELPLAAEYATGTAFYYLQGGRVNLWGQVRRKDGAVIGTGTTTFLTAWPTAARPPGYFSFPGTVVGLTTSGVVPTTRIDVNTGYLRTVGQVADFVNLNLANLSWPYKMNQAETFAAAQSNQDTRPE